jgi:hypothetical protein
MINKLLFRHQKPTQLIVAVFGALFGMILLLGSLQLYFDFRAVMTGTSDINKPQYLVINKEVNMLNTLFGGQKGFSENEIGDLKKIKGVKNAAGLTASRFNVSVSMGSDGMQGIPGMYTQLFFEAVPDQFVDVDQNEWQWNETDSLVPIIVPRDYIKLYNFGFAPSQGLPQVTEGLVRMARFKISIEGPNGKAVYRGKLAGFSERINSILAPQEFIDFANEKYAGVEAGSKDPNRVILECEGPATSELIDYFTENGYETSADAIRNSRLNFWLRTVMTIMVFIGGVIILLALLSFLLYSQLLLSRSSYELQTLIRLGYHYKTLGMRYVKYYSIIYAGILIFTLIVLWLIKIVFASWMNSNGFDVPGGLKFIVLLGGLGFTLLFVGLNSWSVMRGLKKL